MHCRGRQTDPLSDQEQLPRAEAALLREDVRGFGARSMAGSVEKLTAHGIQTGPTLTSPPTEHSRAHWAHGPRPSTAHLPPLLTSHPLSFLVRQEVQPTFPVICSDLFLSILHLIKVIMSVKSPRYIPPPWTKEATLSINRFPSSCSKERHYSIFIFKGTWDSVLRSA